MSKYNMILLGCNVSAHRRGHSHRVARVSAWATCFSSCAGRLLCIPRLLPLGVALGLAHGRPRPAADGAGRLLAPAQQVCHAGLRSVGKGRRTDQRWRGPRSEGGGARVHVGHAVRDALRSADHGLYQRLVLAPLHGAPSSPPAHSVRLAPLQLLHAEPSAASQIPPCIGMYYLWIKVIYPWISKPDEEPGQQPMEQQTKVKYGKGR